MPSIKIEDLESKKELNQVEMASVFGGKKKKKKKNSEQAVYTGTNSNVIGTPSYTADGHPDYHVNGDGQIVWN